MIPEAQARQGVSQSCAHLRVMYRTWENPDGTTSGQWACGLCATQFYTRSEHLAAPAERDQEIERVKGDLTKHEKWMEEVQAHELAMAERENELHDEQDRRINALRAQRDALYQAALAFCHSIESKLKHGRASRKEIALERVVRDAARAAGKEKR